MSTQSLSRCFFLVFRTWNKLNIRSYSSCSRLARAKKIFISNKPVHCIRSYSTRAATSTSRSSRSGSDSIDSHHNQSHTVSQDSKHVQSHHQDGHISQVMRGVMRDLSYPVAVITTCADVEWPFPQSASSYQDLSPFYTSFRGATISSFTSVTLGPPPIVSFNLRVPSKTLSGILRHKEFRVNIPRASETGAAIAHAFVMRNHEEGFETVAKFGHWVGLDNAQSAQTRTSLENSAPFIHGCGIHAVISCKAVPEKFIHVGDHVIVIAEVSSVRHSLHGQLEVSERSRDFAKANAALSYAQQRYRDGSSKAIHVPDHPTHGSIRSLGTGSSSHSDITGQYSWI